MTSSLPNLHLPQLLKLQPRLLPVGPPTQMFLTSSTPPPLHLLLLLPSRHLHSLLLRQIHPVPHLVTAPCHRLLTPLLPSRPLTLPSPLLLRHVHLTLLPLLHPPSPQSLRAGLPTPPSMISLPLPCPPLVNLARRSPRTKEVRQLRILKRRRWSTACGAQLPPPTLNRLKLPGLLSPRLAETLMTCCCKELYMKIGLVDKMDSRSHAYSGFRFPKVAYFMMCGRSFGQMNHQYGD